MKTDVIVRVALVASMLSLGIPAHAQQQSPFEPRLMRLAEILGSLHYLRNLCGETGDTWRAQMEALLASENPDEERRARFVAHFNGAYRAFDGSYSSCTDSAREAINRYMREGAELTRDTAVRFGN
jgi:uncharacterized protein (TIGR02301 family)